MMETYVRGFRKISELDFVNYGIDRSGLIIQWIDGKGGERELSLSPMEAARLMYRADLIDRLEEMDGQPVLYFSTVSDWSNYCGEHEQHVQHHAMTWNDYCELYPIDIYYARFLLMTAMFKK